MQSKIFHSCWSKSKTSTEQKNPKINTKGSNGGKSTRIAMTEFPWSEMTEFSLKGEQKMTRPRGREKLQLCRTNFKPSTIELLLLNSWRIMKWLLITSYKPFYCKRYRLLASPNTCRIGSRHKALNQKRKWHGSYSEWFSGKESPHRISLRSVEATRMLRKIEWWIRNTVLPQLRSIKEFSLPRWNRNTSARSTSNQQFHRPRHSCALQKRKTRVPVSDVNRVLPITDFHTNPIPYIRRCLFSGEAKKLKKSLTAPAPNKI